MVLAKDDMKICNTKNNPKTHVYGKVMILEKQFLKMCKAKINFTNMSHK